MKKFTVLWQEKAEAELANIWDNAADRNRIADDANAIDRMLAESGDKVGESRDNSERVVFQGGLAAQYRVWVEDRRIMVQKVWFVG